MYGNLPGWIISVLIVIATVAGLAWIERRSRPTPPDDFGQNPAHVAPLELPEPPPAAVGSPSPGASPEALQSMIQQVQRRRDALEAFAKAGTITDLPGIEPILQALTSAASADANGIFLPFAQEWISYDEPKPTLEALELAGNVAVRAALLSRHSDPDFAASTFRATFRLGQQLFRDRLTCQQLELGLRFMAESVAGLKRLAQDSGDAAALDQLASFDAQRLALVRNRVVPMASRIRTLDGRMVSANAGNVLRWARDRSAERVWRIESILALGRLRYFAGPTGTLGDQRQANRTLDALENDPDPLIALAARRARSLTIDQYRRLR
ncbi:MAG: hypothetical protein NZ561_07300 [Phycisphaerae bacterium]|nr:hypothetical protein [Phycisphaerae bacterium]MDW8262205.1 hypothetical protein [Phycisphaerales bacterium]